jgi:hypothetical protein
MMRRVCIAIALALCCLSEQQARAVSATGGTVTNYSLGGTNWTAHIFTTGNNTNSATNSIVFSVGGDVEILVIGGGGGGGIGYGAGGGAGGYRYVSTNLPAGTNTVIVGGGGLAGPSSNTRGMAGTNSSIAGIVATGGGGGAGASTANMNGGAGGSGGGGAQNAGGAGTGGTGNTPATSPSQGNNGANGSFNTYGGGGGGIGAAGSALHGGAGASNSISGTLVGYCGGGAGNAIAGAGGLGTASHGGGGRYGSVTNIAAASTGGGGIGDKGRPDGNGGSGIVIVRYVAGGAAAVPARYFYRPNLIMRVNQAIKNQESAQ